MGLQADIKEAIDSGRSDLVRVLAEHRVLPTVVEQSSGSNLLDKSASPTFRLDRQSSTSSGAVDRQTTVQVVDTLGLDSEEACESVREEIRSHSAWE